MKDILGAGQRWFGSSGCKVSLLNKWHNVTAMYPLNFFNFEQIDIYLYLYYIYIIFSHLADAFIQSDLQMRTTEAINCSIKTTKNRYKTES